MFTRTLKIFLIPASLTIILSIMVAFSGEVSSPPEELCRNFVLKEIDTLLLNLQKALPVSKKKINEARRKSLLSYYHEARKHYKQIEFFVEYYSVFDAKYFINGPLVPKHEIEFGPKVYEPIGFQVIESALFNADENKDLLSKQFTLLIDKFNNLKTYYSTVTIEKANYLDALRLQLIRIMGLTLNGYDCTINKEALIECMYSLNGIKSNLDFILNSTENKELKEAIRTLNEAIKYLDSHKNSDTFDRLHFITTFLNPVYSTISRGVLNMNFEPSQVNYAIKLNQADIISLTSLNKQHFSLYRNDTANIEKQALLGKYLFFDPILSGNNKRACASCHKPELAFTDGLNKSIAYDGKHKVTRNSPTLINAIYQKLYFYDGRVFNLEEQAGEVFLNKEEMNSTAEEIVNKLKQSQEYKNLFRESFKGSLDTSVTFYGVIKSVAEYIKTLDSHNSRFDKYIAGETNQLTKNEINGYNLFNGKALCGSCHFFPAFNGLVPPFFNDNEFEVVGTPESSENKILDDDIGREAISQQSIHNRAFKTPGLRNIELTGPYMHNGAYKTIDEVLEFYNKGGGAGFKLPVNNQTLPFDSLGLTKSELHDIKLFLLSLTDTLGLTSKPSRLPLFNNPALDKRKIGGEY